MKNTYKRIFAYLIDILIVSIIVSCFANNSYTNKQLESYSKTYGDYEELTEKYQDFSKDLEEYYEDKKLSEEEYQNLIKDHETFNEDLNKYYKDNELTTKNYKKLTNKINKNLEKEYKKTYKTLNKYSTIYNIYYIVVILIYFVGFNIITKGQTLGKKILRLKIVNNKDNDNVSILNYLIRAVILYNPIYYLAVIIGSYTFDVNGFYTWGIIWTNIKDYLEIILVLMIIIKADGRGLHDILSKTKVVSLDKEGNIIEGKKEEVKSEDSEEVVVEKQIETKKKSKRNKKIIIDDISKEDE